MIRGWVANYQSNHWIICNSCEITKIQRTANHSHLIRRYTTRGDDMERRLLITGCSDPLMWYANMVGQVVTLLGVDDEYYWSREPAGPRNIVKLADARTVV